MKYYYIGYKFYTKDENSGMGSYMIATRDLNIPKISRWILEDKNDIKSVIILSAIEISTKVWDEEDYNGNEKYCYTEK